MLSSTVQVGAMSLPLWVCALLGGIFSGGGTFLCTRRSLRDLELPRDRWPEASAVLSFLLGGGLVLSVLGLNCQTSPDVVPTQSGMLIRLTSHLIFIALLVTISTTDLRSYYILDWNCTLGIVIAVAIAVASGDSQLAHVWVDWNQEIPQLRGPYLPAWLSSHPHLHGFAWSLAGIATGTLLAWLTRAISGFVLARPTFGTGDILLMAMIGAFLGWQSTIVAYLFAPLLALLIGLAIQLTSNRPMLPYGPFLALGAIVVLSSWRWIWMLEIPLTTTANPDRSSIFAVRRFFGDPFSMVMAAGLSLGLFFVMLTLLRIYKSLSFRKDS